jgi:hypothetical protein
MPDVEEDLDKEGPMLKNLTLSLLGLLIVTMAGCAGSKSPSASVAAPANVNGTWTGGTATGASTVTMVLKQTGTNVTGTLTGAGTLDGPIEGIVDGNTIRLSEKSGYGETPLLNVRGDQITGTVRGTTLTLRRVR